jgi:DNA repair exonuclease SbcCD ATPase subunit
MWLKSLHIENMESHVDSFLEFSRHTNSIIGGNWVGKSSIVRALHLLLKNKPSKGADYITDGKKVCTITGVFTDGVKEISLSRKKSKTNIPEYVLDLGDGNPITYKVDSDLPDQIIKYIYVGDTIQIQRDGHYIVFSSSGNVGRTFREAFGLEKLDELNSAAKALHKDHVSECDIARTLSAKYFKSLCLFDRVNFGAIDKDLESCKKSIKDLQNIKDTFILVKDLVVELVQCNDTISILSVKPMPEVLETSVLPDIEEYKSLISSLDEIKSLYEKIKESTDEITKIKVLDIPDLTKDLDSFGKIQASITYIKELIDQIETCESSIVPVVDVPDLSNDLTELNNIETKLVYIKDLVLDLESSEDSIVSLEDAVTTIDTELKSLEKELKSLVCDKCGTLLEGESLKTFMENSK